jgi:hypothetical protein
MADYSLRDAAADLVAHVTTDLAEATERAVSRLSYADLRHAAGRYLMDQARQQWRTEQAERERQATLQKIQTPEYQRRTRERHAKVDAERKERATKLWGDIHQAMADYESSIKVKWAEELLDTGFALPDGTLTTWGDATVEQHNSRIRMLNDQARASTENAARHLKAVNTIGEAGAANLREAVRKLTAAGTGGS